MGAGGKHAEGKPSERERQLLRYLVDGLTNKEIAGRLLVSETSVKTRLQRLFQKSGVRSRAQLVRAALERRQDLLESALIC